MTTQENLSAAVKAWIAIDPDPQTREAAEDLLSAANPEPIQAAFGQRLSFGTAGLRGVVGPGPGRMNRLVVAQTSAGLGDYLLSESPDNAKRGVIVGYDGRIDSKRFAQEAASVLCAQGITVYLGDEPLPTPICAFAVNHLNAAAGVVVTASHNPPEYNGYKVYSGTGSQIIPPMDRAIADAIDTHGGHYPNTLALQDARAQGLLKTIGQDVLDAYVAGVLALVPTSAEAEELSVAYTPLHGVGAPWVDRVLLAAGFSKRHTVAAQREPDGHFPTVAFPNPEEPGAMDLVLQLAKEVDADLALANDPDADRLAVAIKAGDSYRLLRGDEIGVLLAEDALRRHQGQSAMVATTIVSSRMLSAIAENYGALCMETLTGFKWIANAALDHPQLTFLCGYEEALGYTLGTLVRDKDGISALLGFCRLAAELKAKGQTIQDRLDELTLNYGVFLTAQRSLRLERGAPNVGERLRQSPVKAIAGQAVEYVVDLKSGKRTFRDGTQSSVSLPASDVLVFVLDDHSRVIVRPSGTEPKLKCYYEVIAPADAVEVEKQGASAAVAAARQKAQERLEILISEHQASL